MTAEVQHRGRVESGVRKFAAWDLVRASRFSSCQGIAILCSEAASLKIRKRRKDILNAWDRFFDLQIRTLRRQFLCIF